MNHRFHLEPYKGIASRHSCPQCEQKRCFTRYIDSEGEVRFPGYVGRCDREQKCGYHCTPKDYFEQNPESVQSITDYRPSVQPTATPKPTSYIAPDIVRKSMAHYPSNKLFRFLVSKFGESATVELMIRYRVGTAGHWNGATVFWQTDFAGNVRTGKIMLYNPETGRRVKEPHNHITWVHSLLGGENFNLHQCFFGEHLLRSQVAKAVAIVESEKTALIASHYLPSFSWIASGGKNGCFRQENLSVLKNRKVILFPDLGATESWREKLPLFKRLGIDAKLFDYLERNASEKQKQEGYDIADFLLEKEEPHAILQAMLTRNPALQILIEKLDLEVVKVEKTVPEPPRKRGLKM